MTIAENEAPRNTARCANRSTWEHDGERIDLFTLCNLIERNNGPEGLDLHGADLSYIDLRPETLNTVREEVPSTQLQSWVVSGHANLRGAHLEHAALIGARLEHVNFRGARLEEARFASARLDSADFTGADLREADLESARLEKAVLVDAQLRQAHLVGACLQEARLSRSKLQEAFMPFVDLRGARLHQANLQGAILLNANLQQVDLSSAESLSEVSWYGCLLERTRMRREQLGAAVGDELNAKQQKTSKTYRPAMEAYLLLKNNFVGLGRYEDAAWAYAKERQMEKMAYYWEWRSHGWRIWRAWGAFWRWLRNWAFELSTGYGERPQNPVIGGALAVVVFALGYFAGGAITNFGDALVYSLATFATFNLADLQPHGQGVDIASSIEALIGISTLALVVFTLGNRMSRS